MLSADVRVDGAAHCAASVPGRMALGPRCLGVIASTHEDHDWNLAVDGMVEAFAEKIYV